MWVPRYVFTYVICFSVLNQCFKMNVVWHCLWRNPGNNASTHNSRCLSHDPFLLYVRGSAQGDWCASGRWRQRRCRCKCALDVLVKHTAAGELPPQRRIHRRRQRGRADCHRTCYSPHCTMVYHVVPHPPASINPVATAVSHCNPAYYSTRVVPV